MFITTDNVGVLPLFVSLTYDIKSQKQNIQQNQLMVLNLGGQ